MPGINAPDFKNLARLTDAMEETGTHFNTPKNDAAKVPQGANNKPKTDGQPLVYHVKSTATTGFTIPEEFEGPRSMRDRGVQRGNR